MRLLIIILSVIACLMPWRMALAGGALPDQEPVMSWDRSQGS